MSVQHAQRKLERAGDAELVQLARGGDADAYAALFRRHAASAAAVARSVTSTFDPDDLVSEAYTRVLQALRAGNGPTGAFRPYLFTTIRNISASWGRAGRNTVSVDPEEFDEMTSGEDLETTELDRSITAQAFRSLPPRWQEALWYSEVEGMPPAQLAPILGLSAQAAAALSYRAREGLRQAWIRAHLTSAQLEPDCAWTVERLAARARGKLGKRERSRVEDHLATCVTCPLIAEEAREVGDRLTLVLLPLAIGFGAAAAYAAVAHSSAASATAAGATAAGSAAGGSAAGTGAGSAGAGATGSGSAVSSAGASGATAGTGATASSGAAAAGTSTGFFGGTTGLVIGVTAAVLVVGAAVAGVALVASASDHATTDASGTETTAPASSAPAPRPTPSPSPSTSASPTPSPSSIPPAAETDATATNPDSSPGAPPPASSVVAPVGPAETSSPGSLPGTSPQPDPPQPVAPAAPVVNVDTAGGRYFPLVSGTAAPNATVTVSGGGTTVTVGADASGVWRVGTAFTGYGSGPGAVTAKQTDADGLSSSTASASFTLTAPQVSASSLLQHGIPLAFVRITGQAGSSVELFTDGTTRGVRSLGSAGRYDEPVLFTSPGGSGGHVVLARYTDGAGRFGPGATAAVTQ